MTDSPEHALAAAAPPGWRARLRSTASLAHAAGRRALEAASVRFTLLAGAVIVVIGWLAISPVESVRVRLRATVTAAAFQLQEPIGIGQGQLAGVEIDGARHVLLPPRLLGDSSTWPSAVAGPFVAIQRAAVGAVTGELGLASDELPPGTSILASASQKPAPSYSLQIASGRTERLRVVLGRFVSVRTSEFGLDHVDSGEDLPEIEAASEERFTIRFELPADELEVFREPVRISTLRFFVPKDHGKPAESSIREGSVSFVGTAGDLDEGGTSAWGKPLKLAQGCVVHLHDLDGEMRMRAVENGTLDASLLGRVSSIGVGHDRFSIVDRTPSRLDRIRAEPALQAAVSTVMAVVAVLYGVFQLWTKQH